MFNSSKLSRERGKSTVTYAHKLKQKRVTDPLINTKQEFITFIKYVQYLTEVSTPLTFL